MNGYFQKNHRLLFFGAWLFLGLIQAGLTELQDDEAYYWVYSRFLDWGYFDHPPMTALLVKMGYAIFPNELGVRLFPLLLNVLSVVIIEKLIVNKNPILFYIIALSIAVLQLSGFVAVPDIPLIFFTALFFWMYRRFFDRMSLTNTLLLGVSVALLFYSKYHAVLIVLFTLLSNIKLLTRYQTYIAGIFALTLFSPHLWWQYQHDWVSFRYHLFESNVNAYKFSFTSEYILGQLLLPGPISGIILLPAAFLYKPKNETEKALRYTLIGIYTFFLLSSFRGKVEGNWTSPVLVSLMVLSHQFINEHVKWKKILYRLLPFTMLLVLIARIIMIADIIPMKEVRVRYHAWKKWPRELREKTNAMPVVFSNSYQRASKYWFYSGQTTYSQNWYRERRNNYNFWPIEDSMIGKPVYYLDKYLLYRFPDSIKTAIGWVGYRYDSSLASFAKINVKAAPLKPAIKQGDSLDLDCTFEIPAPYASYINSRDFSDDTIRIALFNKQKWLHDIIMPIRLKQINAQQHSRVKIEPALTPGKYYLRFAINCGQNNPTHNSAKIDFEVVR
jgi:hypothetical protein